jgi:hypothetical protein
VVQVSVCGVYLKVVRSANSIACLANVCLSSLTFSDTTDYREDLYWRDVARSNSQIPSGINSNFPTLRTCVEEAIVSPVAFVLCVVLYSMEPLDALCERNASIFIVKSGGTYTYHTGI